MSMRCRRPGQAVDVSTLLMLCAVAGCVWFKPGVKVETFAPTGEVARKTNFTITFSRSMVEEESVGVWIEPAFLKIEPSIEGRCKWISETELRFYPEEQLKPSTRYRLEILPDIVRTEEYRLVGQRSFEFHTSRIAVIRYNFDYRIDEELPGKARLHLTLEFNYDVPPEDLQERLSLKFERAERIEYRIEQKNPARLLTAISDTLPLRDIDRKIELHIDKSLKPFEGELSLYEDYHTVFKMPARKQLVVESAYPECSEKANWITVRLSTPVNIKAIRDFMQIEPEIDFYLEFRHPYLRIHGEFSPGEEYILTLRKGLPAMNGNKLENEFSTVAHMEELSPHFAFLTEGVFLPQKGNLNIGIETVNIDSLELSVEKLFINNLVHFLNVNPMSREHVAMDHFGKHITRQVIEIEAVRNAKVITTVDMSGYLEGERQGMYILVLRRPEHRWEREIQWVRITDLGVMAKIASDELMVMVNSLETLAPVPGATVRLISQTNQTLLDGLTDSRGIARFSDYQEAVEGFHSFLITVEKGRDLSFAKLSDCRLPLADFDVGGAPPSKGGYEAFLYTERGVYRPGDTVRTVALVRDAEGRVPPDFPLKMVVIAPDGSLFNEYRGRVGDAGADEFSIAVPIYAMTGVYMAKLLVADTVEIGRVRFNVEEFMPQRIKVDLSLDKNDYWCGEDVELQVRGMMLFGPPAAGRRVKAKCTLASKVFRPAEFSDFCFVDNEKHLDKVDLELGEATLDGTGNKVYEVHVPEEMKAPSSVVGRVEVSVFELGGRAVTEYTEFTIHPYPYYVGLHRSEEGYATLHEEVQIEYVVVEPDGKRAPALHLKSSFYRVKWHSILERTGTGYYRYVSQRSLDLIEEKEISYEGDVSSVSFTPHHYGQFLVLVEDPESGASSSMNFYVSGWGYAPWAMSEPEKLFFDFDKESYQVGDEAVVQIRAPFGGQLLLTVECDRILEQRILQMGENTATVRIPVREEFMPNVYVVGTLVRSEKSQEVHAPVRAYGAYPLTIDCEEKRLRVELKAPGSINPLSTLDVMVGVSGGSDRTYLTVAAVDEGICQITDFSTPDPFGFFYRKRRLSVQSYDIYSFIFPEIEETQERSSPGGGRAEELARHLMPVALRRVKPVALWSGIVRVDEMGRARIRFEVPQFQGNLRIMAVAWDGDTYGSTFTNLTVSDPIVLTPTFPRFVAGKDSFEIPVNIYNGMDKDGDIAVMLSVDGPVDILPPNRLTVNVLSKQEKLVKFACKAENEVGALHFRLDASGLGSKTRYEVDVPLRPASPLVSDVGAGRIDDDGEISFQISPDWVTGTTRFHLNLSSFPTINFGHSLRFLLKYPHGCIEQTTSKLFPLLYFQEIAKVVEPSLFKDRSADYYIQEGITRLRSMQMPSGGFAYWPGGEHESEWGSIYATHFLVEAGRAGYQIPDWTLSKATKHCRSFLRQKLQSGDRTYRLQRQVYALYVLALHGEPDRSTMNYLKQVELKNMSRWEQFLLAGAFALSGDLETARTMIPLEIAPSEAPRETGHNFNSGTRENAIMLEVLTEIDPYNPSIPVLVQAISDRLKGRGFYTTQGAAFGFMALGKSLKAHEDVDYTGEVWWDDTLLSTFDTENRVIEEEGGEAREVRIKIAGRGPCYYYWDFSGIKKDADIEEYDRGLSVRRIYLDELDYGNIRQGDVIVARITITALTDDLDNVIVTDMLPAGLETENPRLESSAQTRGTYRSVTPDYMDIRDDRLNIYLDLRRGKSVDFHYMLRAVTVGSFVLPPVKAEAMYDPFKSSVANSGAIRVVGAK